MKPYFPTIEDLLDVFFQELPDGLYPVDRADNADLNKRSYSSSEIRAVSQFYADLYTNLFVINKNKFASTVDADNIGLWEKDWFKDPQDQTLIFSAKKDNLLAKIRLKGGISLPVVKGIVDGILTPKGLAFDVIPWNGCGTAAFGPKAWLLDITPLDVWTYLAEVDPLYGMNRDLVPLDCALNYAAAGITADDLAGIQRTAYTYEVQIYGVADADTLALLDKTLTAKEPARSTHVIRNNAPPIGYINPDLIDAGSFGGEIIDSLDGGGF